MFRFQDAEEGLKKANKYYFEEKEALYSMISNRYLPTNKVSLLTPSQKNNSELFTKINPSKPANLDIYNSDESGIISHLSEKQDLVVFMPKSSNLELLRRTPEYGILFDTNNLDGIIENELNGLSDITQYVKDGGKLIYAVPTFDIKETGWTVEEPVTIGPGTTANP